MFPRDQFCSKMQVFSVRKEGALTLQYVLLLRTMDQVVKVLLVVLSFCVGQR